MKPPKVVRKVVSTLSDEEIRAILNSFGTSPTDARNQALFMILLDTGLRIGELINLKMEDVHMDKGYLKVMGKGDKERIVPIGKFVQMELLHYIEKVRPQPYGSGCDKLFLSRGGKPITVNTVKLVFSRLAKSSGVNRLHAHLCRHTFAINYLLNGGDIFPLREIIGHTTLEMVNHYLHFTSSQITAQHHKYSPMDRIQEKEG
ncbi:tyrosine-type recombinase/integrase [Chloroflexota bacterium]